MITAMTHSWRTEITTISSFFLESFLHCHDYYCYYCLYHFHYSHDDYYHDY